MRYLFLPFIVVFIAVVFLIFPSSRSFGRITLKDAMTKQELQKTGIADLSYTQKVALECWINDYFEAKQCLLDRKSEPAYLTLNTDDGAKLEFSNGSVYEIHPDDRIYTSYWITPFPVEFCLSGNPDYPIKITNLQTGTEVLAREISVKDMREPKKNKPISPSPQSGPQNNVPYSPGPPQKDIPPTGNPFSPPINPSSLHQPSEQEFLK